MDPDLDTLCTAVHVTADDLLAESSGNARRELTDAEVVTLAVAQVAMGVPFDRCFLAVARHHLAAALWFGCVPSGPRLGG